MWRLPFSFTDLVIIHISLLSNVPSISYQSNHLWLYDNRNKQVDKYVIVFCYF
jgi:hypothetical protein